MATPYSQRPTRLVDLYLRAEEGVLVPRRVRAPALFDVHTTTQDDARLANDACMNR